MNRWLLIGSLVFGGVFALFAFGRIESDVLDSRMARFVTAFFLFGTYYGLVIFGTTDKKRSLSLPAQTFLGIAFALAIAALCKAGAEGYALAIMLGLLLGLTADKWVEHIPFP